jgi:transglutaminase-like putative cysteine protease
MDLLDDINDWLEELEGSHKVLLGVGVFFISRWLYDEFRDARKSSKELPAAPSDSPYSRAHIPLSTNGNAGVYATLDKMAWLVRADGASQYLRRFVTDLVGECPGHDADCEIRRCYEYARDKITYRRDPANVESISDARRTIEAGYGDCDDKVILLCSLLGVIGYRTRFVVCGFKPNHFSHVYLEVHTRRGWLGLDPTPENAPYGWQQKAAPYREVFEIYR